MRRLGLMMLLVAACTVAASAQETTGTHHRRRPPIRPARVLPGVTVTIKNTNTGVVAHGRHERDRRSTPRRCCRSAPTR